MPGTTRTRSKTGYTGSIITVPYVMRMEAKAKAGNICPAVSYTEMSGSDNGHQNSWETMSDVIGPRDSDGYLPQRSVNHTRMNNPFNTTSDFWYRECYRKMSFKPPWGGAMLFSASRQLWDVSPSSSVLGAACGEAFTTFNTQFPEEISILNFLWELRELGQLIPKLTGAFRKRAAGAYLSVEFGWKPLIGDIKALFNVLGRIDDRLNYLRERYKKATRLGYSVPNIYSLPVGMKARQTLAYNCAYEYELTGFECKFTAGGNLYHSLEWVLNTQRDVRALLGAFGVTNPAKIVWNMIPWSFVVGWFVNVEALLGRYALLQERSEHWQIRRLSWSYKLKSTFKCSRINLGPSNPNSGTAWIPVANQHIGTYVYSKYVRNPGLLETGISILNPSARQLALLAALGLGKS